MLSIVGLISSITLFPSGIYYGFVCGVLGAAGGILSRPYLKRKSSCTASVIMGVISVLICAVAFHGLHSLYTMLKDPVAGPKVTELIRQILNQYGLSLDTFAQIMRQ